MKKLGYFFLAITLTLASCKNNNSKDVAKATDLAHEAYVFAFAAVENNKLISDIINTSIGAANTLSCSTELSNPDNSTVVTPNNDTYYGQGVLDLRAEPVVITVPKIDDRYFSFQLIDVFTNCPDYIGSRTTGVGPGSYLVASSDWKGNTPSGISSVIRIPAKVVLMLSRTQAITNPDQKALDLQSQYKITPLHKFIGTQAPTELKLSLMKDYDAKTGDVEGFFKVFNNIIQYQILTEQEQALMVRYAEIGIGAGKEFNKKDFSPEVWAAIEAGAIDARNEIIAETQSSVGSVNGWGTSPKNSGKWGTDYINRSMVAWQYIYVNTCDEAMYYTGLIDGSGKTLDAATNNYTITFPKDGFPNSKYFWSITIYNKNGTLVKNSIDRYNISSSSYGQQANDGSSVIYIQKDKPVGGVEANWLPAPAGKFYLIFRIYGPDQDIISGKYKLPSIMKTALK